MKNMIQKLNSKKGFTLMEMLIVVAIIAVLVAIAIPTFSGALTKANEAADVANIRAAYAEWQIQVLDGNLTAAPTDVAGFVHLAGANVTLKSPDLATYVAPTGTADGSITYDPSDNSINGGAPYTWTLSQY